MSNEAAVYTYQNVGAANPGVDDGQVYTYANIGIFGATSYLGRVLGMVSPRLVAALYSYLNQLDQTAGATRLLEDGTTRHMEDGTARTLE